MILTTASVALLLLALICVISCAKEVKDGCGVGPVVAWMLVACLASYGAGEAAHWPQMFGTD